MNKLFIALSAVLLLLSLLLTGCQNLVKGSGEVKTQDYDFTDFTSVEIDGPFEVNITPAGSYHVHIIVDDNLFDKINISNEEKVLKIALQKSKYLSILRSQYVDATAKVVITTPPLRSLLLSGAAKGNYSDFDSRVGVIFNISGASSLDIKDMSAGDVNLIVSGASKVAGKIAAGDVVFDMVGASTVHLEGSANNMACKAGGSSQLELNNFIVTNAYVQLKGGSRGIVKPHGKLDVNLSGASNLIYLGEPVLGNTKISGGSTMTRK